MGDDGEFKDHFSGASREYLLNRPRYPDALFAFLAEQAPARQLAWDCATGTGQAALGLAAHFARVVASDASASQIADAQYHPHIEYRVARAEASGLTSGSVDLVSVAQALHWFDIRHFFLEARRVLRPGGIIAVWSYNLLRVTPAIDALITHLYGTLLAEYWPAERRLVESEYRDIVLPFQPLVTPSCAMEAHWPLDQLLGYLRTWSAVRRYQEANGEDPVALVVDEFASLWGRREMSRVISWPLSIRAGVSL